MNPALLQRAASYLRTGISYGVLPGIRAVEWADRLILAEGEVPAAVFDVALAPPDRPSVLVAALTPLAGEDDPSEPIVRAVLDDVGAALRAGRVTVRAGLELAYRITRALGDESSLRYDAMMLREDYSLAQEGIFGDVADLDHEARTWFAQFAGAAAAIGAPAG